MKRLTLLGLAMLGLAACRPVPDRLNVPTVVRDAQLRTVQGEPVSCDYRRCVGVTATAPDVLARRWGVTWVDVDGTLTAHTRLLDLAAGELLPGRWWLGATVRD